jgi:hypothetical protein
MIIAPVAPVDRSDGVLSVTRTLCRMHAHHVLPRRYPAMVLRLRTLSLVVTRWRKGEGQARHTLT